MTALLDIAVAKPGHLRSVVLASVRQTTKQNFPGTYARMSGELQAVDYSELASHRHSSCSFAPVITFCRPAIFLTNTISLRC